MTIDMPIPLMQEDLFNPKRHMHPNSLNARKEDKDILAGRSLAILDHIRADGPGTDRQIAKRMGFNHRSMVQPRISDLIRKGHLIELLDTIDDETGKCVRMVGLP